MVGTVLLKFEQHQNAAGKCCDEPTAAGRKCKFSALHKLQDKDAAALVQLRDFEKAQPPI
jgi:hypothetical protein